jgi:hypothetical protein
MPGCHLQKNATQTVSAELLGQFDLIDHAVGELGEILLVAGREHDPEPDAEFSVRLCSPGQGDLRVVVHDGHARLTWSLEEADEREPSLNIDKQARHVFIWGRRPDDRGHLRSRLTQPDLARLQALLSGY